MKQETSFPAREKEAARKNRNVPPVIGGTFLYMLLKRIRELPLADTRFSRLSLAQSPMEADFIFRNKKSGISFSPPDGTARRVLHRETPKVSPNT